MDWKVFSLFYAMLNLQVPCLCFPSDSERRWGITQLSNWVLLSDPLERKNTMLFLALGAFLQPTVWWLISLGETPIWKWEKLLVIWREGSGFSEWKLRDLISQGRGQTEIFRVECSLSQDFNKTERSDSVRSLAPPVPFALCLDPKFLTGITAQRLDNGQGLDQLQSSEILNLFLLLWMWKWSN